MTRLIEVSKENWAKYIDRFENHKRGRAVFIPGMKLRYGKLQIDALGKPVVLLYSNGPIHFITGDSTHTTALKVITNFPPMNLLATPDDSWSSIVRSLWKMKLGVQHRTRMSPESLNIDHICSLIERLPSQFKIVRMNLNDLQYADTTLVGEATLFWKTYENLAENGLAFCIKHKDAIVSVAYTAFPFIDEFEIQVATINSPKYRRKGLATAVCASLIEYALRNGLTPHWDAANQPSVSLAMKLGYSNPDQWEVFYRTP